MLLSVIHHTQVYIYTQTYKNGDINLYMPGIVSYANNICIVY